MQNQGANRRGNTTSNGSFISRGGGFVDRQRPGGFNTGGGFISRGARGGGGGGSYRDGPRFDGDYDFETANERFQETLNHMKDEFTTKTKLGKKCIKKTINFYITKLSYEKNTVSINK